MTPFTKASIQFSKSIPFPAMKADQVPLDSIFLSQAQASLGRFLDRRTSSVQDASCAASDAQGRLNRLQEQSRTVPWLWGSVGPVQTQTFK